VMVALMMMVVLYVASLTTLHLQVPCKLHDCLTVCDHDVPVLINAACLDSSQLDLSTRQVTLPLSSACLSLCLFVRFCGVNCTSGYSMNGVINSG